MNTTLLFILCFSSSFAALDTEWYKHSVIYELLVQTFQDSDDDGIGDIKGIISRIDHLSDLGIDMVYLTPIYKSNMRDMGYDIINYYKIDSRYGTMDDFDQLVKKMNSQGIKIMMDLVINHSSKEHEWFKKSVKRIDPYTDYYVWENAINYGDDNNRYPPNNWQSIFEGSSWTWDENRNQYYYHMFLPEQPDLNLRNENVKQEVKKIIKFWLDKGVAGFRLDAPMCYMENKNLRDDIEGQSNQKESFEFMHELREFIDDYNKKNGDFERILAPEVHGPLELVHKYFGKEGYPITHLVFNYRFEYEKHAIKADEIESIIQTSLAALPPGGIFAWVTQSHDQPRTGSRIAETYMDIFTIITALLPGVFHVYYGQEIGLLNGFVQPFQYKDFSGKGARDPNRLLMQWNSSINAGFSNSLETFSPTCMDYGSRNVKAQKDQPTSHMNLLKSLIWLRKSRHLRQAELRSFILSKDVLFLWRAYRGKPFVFAVFNLANETTTFDLSSAPFQPEDSRVYAVFTASINSRYSRGDTVSGEYFHKFSMEPQSAVVFAGVELAGTSGHHYRSPNDVSRMNN